MPTTARPHAWDDTRKEERCYAWYDNMELAKLGCGFIRRALRLLLYQSSSAASWQTKRDAQKISQTLNRCYKKKQKKTFTACWLFFLQWKIQCSANDRAFSLFSRLDTNILISRGVKYLAILCVHFNKVVSILLYRIFIGFYARSISSRTRTFVNCYKSSNE